MIISTTAILLQVSSIPISSAFTTSIIQKHPSAQSGSQSQLNMVSATERLVLQHSSQKAKASHVVNIRTTKVTSSRNQKSDATSSNTSSRSVSSGTSRRGTGSSPSTITKSSSMEMKMKPQSNNSNRSSINAASTREASSSSPVSSITATAPATIGAQTAESLYNLPSYMETATEEWKDFISTPTSSLDDLYTIIPNVSNKSNKEKGKDIQKNDTIKPTATVSNTSTKSRRRHTTTRNLTTSSSSVRIKKTKSSTKPTTTSSSYSTPHPLTKNINSSSSTTTPTSTLTGTRTLPISNKSSTMPGFLNSKYYTHRRSSFRDGMTIVQKANVNNSNAIKAIQNITRKEGESKKRSKANSEAMYMSSASVPDSLIAFTNEIHLVSFFFVYIIIFFVVVGRKGGKIRKC